LISCYYYSRFDTITVVRGYGIY